MKLAHLPLRVATGAYILNSGLNKQNLEGEAAEGVHGMAWRLSSSRESSPPAKLHLVQHC